MENTGSFRLVGSVATAAEAIAAAQQHQPDLIVLDLVLGSVNGLELIPELLAIVQNACIVVYSTLDEKLYAPRAFAAGARGYVAKQTGLLSLLGALQSVASGTAYASDSVKVALLENSIKAKTGPAALGMESLSDRELYVFRMVGSGLALSAIAAQLGVSPKTVSTYRERIKNKLGFQSGRDLDNAAEQFFLSA